ncbi:class I SAM-dependent methyltransferase, partial [Aerococcus mictus]
PGGKLIIANVKQGRETCQWPLEFVTDWSLIYRTEDDMRAMLKGLDVEKVTIEEDATKCVWVMVADKPL